jgi:hypothetical protein
MKKQIVEFLKTTKTVKRLNELNNIKNNYHIVCHRLRHHIVVDCLGTLLNEEEVYSNLETKIAEYANEFNSKKFFWISPLDIITRKTYSYED